jgi:hypothetical protein
MAVGYFNGDGKTDLAIAGGYLTVLLGDGAGGFTPALGSPFLTENDPRSVAMGLIPAPIVRNAGASIPGAGEAPGGVISSRGAADERFGADTEWIPDAVVPIRMQRRANRFRDIIGFTKSAL